MSKEKMTSEQVADLLKEIERITQKNFYHVYIDKDITIKPEIYGENEEETRNINNYIQGLKIEDNEQYEKIINYTMNGTNDTDDIFYILNKYKFISWRLDIEPNVITFTDDFIHGLIIKRKNIFFTAKLKKFLFLLGIDEMKTRKNINKLQKINEGLQKIYDTSKIKNDYF